MAAIKHTLVVDAGNTLIKLAHFNGNELASLHVLPLIDVSNITAHLHNASVAIISSVSVDSNLIQKLLAPLPCLIFSAHTPLPFINDYETPQTLGADRLAGIAGAKARHPDKPVLVIDSGTCVTYDLLTADGHYQGGAISPGLHMRLRAMQTFTQRLPLPEWQIPEQITGKNTAACLLAGAYFGLIDEINGRISRYEETYRELQTLLCGGNAGILQKQLKNNIFAAPNLVLEGLNQILHYNVK